jgi:hypothetical protein
LKKTRVILIFCLSFSAIGQNTNSFVLIYPKGQSYAPILLPIDDHQSFISEIKIIQFSDSISNGTMRIYENGIHVKSYSKINLDSIDWKGKDKNFIPAYTTNYSGINLPLYLAIPYHDSLKLAGKYFYTNMELNTEFPYQLVIQGRYNTVPDTTGLTFSEKQELSNDYKLKLTKELKFAFPNLYSEIYVSSTFPFEPRIQFYLKNKKFELQKLESLNFHPNHTPQIIWRDARFVILEQ